MIAFIFSNGVAFRGELRYTIFTMSLPDFNAEENLPPGIHHAAWEEVAARFGGNARRITLLFGLKAALDALSAAGCRTAYLDGSFVTIKPVPGDFDACWEVAGVDIARLDPVFLTFTNGRAAQKLRFGGELFPADLPEGASGKTFLEFFQTDRRTGEPKGVIMLDLARLL